MAHLRISKNEITTIENASDHIETYMNELVDLCASFLIESRKVDIRAWKTLLIYCPNELKNKNYA